MLSIIWTILEVLINLNQELIHVAFNKSIIGKLIRPITTFFMNIERRIEREYDLQRGLVIIFSYFRLGKILNYTMIIKWEEISCSNTLPENRNIFLIMKITPISLDS